MDTSISTLDRVKAVIVETLGIDDRLNLLGSSTPLLGGIPELDSMAVVKLAMSLEEHFGFEIDNDDFTSEVFETIGTLARFVEQKLK